MVMIEARVYRQVAVAKKDIAIREKLSAENVRLERRPVEGRVARQATEDFQGKVATHAIRKGAILLVSDMRKTAVPTLTRETVIKRGDFVRVVARGHGLTVSLRACESLENGREGETIRLRNPSSKKVVTGRVVAAGEVEIVL